MKSRILSLTCLLTLAATPFAFGQIAITEFSNDPVNGDQTTEFVELFNFSTSAVSLTGWTFQDNNGTGTISGTPSLASGGYLILTRNKGNFENVWFGGTPNAGVTTAVSVLANGGEFVELKNSTGNLIWSAGLTGNLLSQSGAPTLALAANFDFSSIAQTGYVADDSLYTNSSVGDANGSFTSPGIPLTVTGGDVGSPLLGGYSVVPEPTSLALLGLGAASLLVRRRRR